MAKKSTRKLSAGTTASVPLDQIVVDPILNRFLEYPSANLGPQRLAEIFRAADQGDLFAQAQLFEEMLEKDTHLFAVVDRRISDVLAKPWKLDPPTTDKEDVMRTEYVLDVLNSMGDLSESISATQDAGDFDSAKAGILSARPFGISFQQIYWQQSAADVWIDKVEWTHPKNFRFGLGSDPRSNMNEIRRITAANRFDGVPLEAGRWLVATMPSRVGHASRSSYMRPVSWWYLFKNFDIKAWIRFLEVFGMPLRVGSYSRGTSVEDKRTLLNMLRQMAQDGAAIKPDDSKIDFIEAAGKAASVDMYESMHATANSEMSKAVLGHSAGADSTPGKLGGEDVAQGAIDAVVNADARRLDKIVMRQLIRPIYNAKFGDGALPKHITIIDPPRDLAQTATIIDLASNRLGLPLAKQDVYSMLNLPTPAKDAELIAPLAPGSMPAPGNVPAFNLTADDAGATGNGKKKVRS